MSDLTNGKCMKPQDPRPLVCTSFCVYPEEHEGEHSWADVQAIRTERLRAYYYPKGQKSGV